MRLSLCMVEGCEVRFTDFRFFPLGIQDSLPVGTRAWASQNPGSIFW